MEISMTINAKPYVIHYWASLLILAIIFPVTSFANDGQEPTSTSREIKTWTYNVGLGASKAWNLVGITKEHFVSDNASVFVTAGLGEMVLGAGVAFYANRDGSGVVASAVAGTGVQFALSYRRKLGGADFLTLGGSYISVFGFSDVDHPGVIPVCAYEHRF